MEPFYHLNVLGLLRQPLFEKNGRFGRICARRTLRRFDIEKAACEKADPNTPVQHHSLYSSGIAGNSDERQHLL